MSTLKATAQRAGLLYLIFAILGVIGEFVLPRALVPGDAAATAANVMDNELIYRLGVLNGLLTLVLFIYLAECLYNLFKSTDHRSLIRMVLLVSVGIAVAIANVVTSGAPLILLGGADYFTSFSKSQLDALVMTFVRLHGFGGTVAMAFWGLWLFPFGMLVIRSGFIPRIYGYLLIVAGVAYAVTSVAFILLPDYRQLVSNIMMPLYFGELPIIFWLLIKGVRDPAPAEAVRH